MQAGVYKYKTRYFDGTFETHQMNVEIVKEFDKTYQIRFLEAHADGRGFGFVTKVRKKSVWVATGARSLQPKKELWSPYKN